MPDRALIAIDATSVPAQPAGAGRYTLSLVQALSRVDREHDYVVFTRRHSIEELRDLAPSFEVVDVGEMTRSRRYVWEQTALPLALRRRGVKLLHSPHHSLPLVCPCPRVVTVHDVTFFLLPERYPVSRRLFFQLMTLMSVRRARAVIVPSACAADDLRVTLHPPSEKVFVTHEGVDACFRPVNAVETDAVGGRYELPKGYILSLGTREPGKNRSTLLRALKLLVDQGRDMQLAVVGQAGWQAGAEADEASALGLTGRVHFTGYVAQADLPALYSGARAFVFPSLHEGFGLPVLEAMACGTPVVCSNTSSLPEVAGEAALLVDPTDAEAIATAVGRILDDRTLAALLGQAGIEHAAEFTWDTCAEATLRVYRRVLGEADDA